MNIALQYITLYFTKHADIITILHGTVHGFIVHTAYLIKVKVNKNRCSTAI